MSSKKIHTLSLIKRLRKLDLEKEATVLGEIRREQSELEGRKEQCLSDLKRDTGEITAEQAQYVGYFVKAVQSELKSIDTKIDNLANVAARHERIVSRKFSDMKTVDMVLDRETERVKDAHKKIERSQMEDLSIMRYKKASRL